MSDLEFDYVICGAGSAGCTVAERLSRDPGVSVLVLEAGGSDNSPNAASRSRLAALVPFGNDARFGFFVSGSPI